MAPGQPIEQLETEALLDTSSLQTLIDLPAGAAGATCGPTPCASLAPLLGLAPTDVIQTANEQDQLGLRHVRCRQVLNGVPGTRVPWALCAHGSFRSARPWTDAKRLFNQTALCGLFVRAVQCC